MRQERQTETQTGRDTDRAEQAEEERRSGICKAGRALLFQVTYLTYLAGWYW